MTSWDCFDTLIARRYVHPHSVFNEVGKQLGISDFTELRIEAEKQSNGTYDDIYNRLPGIDKNIELQIEKEHLFPIVENMNRVNDGDIIVSDMYLSVEQVTDLLRSCGLTKDVKVYVTWGGKWDGWIWDKIERPDLHVGDNLRSDVLVPREKGINVEFYTDHAFNDVELETSKLDVELACWMRMTRLSCPYRDSNKLIWNDQAGLNIPTLALASLELPDEPLAFTYRTSANWLTIYKAVVGGDAIEYQTSRQCYADASDAFVKYFQEQIIDGCRTIVDVQGSGKSLESFLIRTNLPTPGMIYLTGPVSMNYSSIARNASGFEEWLNVKTDACEKLNLLDVGAISSWDDSGIKRLSCEHDLQIVKVQQEAIEVAIDLLKYFNIQPNKQLLLMLLEKMNNCFTNHLLSRVWTTDNTKKI
jgi:hypothetical protein